MLFFLKNQNYPKGKDYFYDNLEDCRFRKNEREKKKLDSIFSRHYERVVNNDFTVSHQKHYYQLEKSQPVTICKQDVVTIEERMDKSIHLRLRGKYLNYQLLPERPQKLSLKEKQLNWVIPRAATYIPPADHPWRQYTLTSQIKKTN